MWPSGGNGTSSCNLRGCDQGCCGRTWLSFHVLAFGDQITQLFNSCCTRTLTHPRSTCLITAANARLPTAVQRRRGGQTSPLGVPASGFQSRLSAGVTDVSLTGICAAGDCVASLWSSLQNSAQKSHSMSLACSAGSIGLYRPCSACHRQSLRPAQVSAVDFRQSRRDQRLQAVSRPLEACQQHDLLQITLTNGSIEHVEVLEGWNATQQNCKLLWKGQLLQLASAPGQQSGHLQLQPLGGHTRAPTLDLQRVAKGCLGCRQAE